MSATVDQLEAAIAAQETQRGLLGDAVVEAGTAPLREKLALLRSQTRARSQQLKAVSVLFVDLVSSTAMSRTLDPEDIHAIVDGALERFSAVVVARQGRVLQYAGDSLLAAFGADGAHEDDAENAVHAGLAIIEEARRVVVEIEASYRITASTCGPASTPGRCCSAAVSTTKAVSAGSPSASPRAWNRPLPTAACGSRTTPIATCAACSTWRRNRRSPSRAWTSRCAVTW